jgi:hypothetical protein
MRPKGLDKTPKGFNTGIDKTLKGWNDALQGIYKVLSGLDRDGRDPYELHKAFKALIGKREVHRN